MVKSLSFHYPPQYTVNPIPSYAPPVPSLREGLGGFSAGAIQAGADVVLGVDSDPAPLKLWGVNVPGAAASLSTLGAGWDHEASLPPPAPDLHIHASSPCTDLSCARGASVTADDIQRGVAMLAWCLDLVLQRGDYSWSIENVSTIVTRNVLSDYTTRFPTRVAYASLDAASYGACQTRVRLIAGPPELIRKLQEMPPARRVSVRDAFSAAGLEVPAPCFKNQTRSRSGGPCKRTVEELSFTVCASHGLTWCSNKGETLRVMTGRESGILMGFPLEWRLPPGSRAGQRAVGNAVCTAMSRAITQAAISVQTGETLVQTHSTQSPTRELPPLNYSNDAPDDRGAYRRLRKRVRTLEHMVSNLQTSLQLSMSGQHASAS
jgi:hypothetical protein